VVKIISKCIKMTNNRCVKELLEGSVHFCQNPHPWACLVHQMHRPKSITRNPDSISLSNSRLPGMVFCLKPRVCPPLPWLDKILTGAWSIHMSCFVLSILSDILMVGPLICWVNVDNLTTCTCIYCSKVIILHDCTSITITA